MPSRSPRRCSRFCPFQHIARRTSYKCGRSLKCTEQRIARSSNFPWGFPPKLTRSSRSLPSKLIQYISLYPSNCFGPTIHPILECQASSKKGLAQRRWTLLTLLGVETGQYPRHPKETAPAPGRATEAADSGWTTRGGGPPWDRYGRGSPSVVAPTSRSRVLAARRKANGASLLYRIRRAYRPAASGDYPGRSGYSARKAFRRRHSRRRGRHPKASPGGFRTPSHYRYR